MVLAHAGDWVSDVLFAGPVLALFIWVSIAKVRERRAARQEDPEPPTDGDQPEAKGNQRDQEN